MGTDLRKHSPGFDSTESRPIYSARSMAGRPNPGDPNNLWGGMSTGITISTTLLAGLFVWGGVGWLVDHLAGTGKVFTAIGILLGAALGVYLIYIKYGKEHHHEP
jgi:F0F1-type ATP synthase assembly protein I